MEMKWKKNEIKELELLKESKTRQVLKEIEDLKSVGYVKKEKVPQPFGLY